MDQDPLVSEEIDAGAELARRFDEYQPVKAAFWFKASSDGRRHLYLASDRIDDTNFDLAYGEVLRLTNQMRTPYLSPFQVRVIGGDDPRARAATEFRELFTGPVGVRVHDTDFGGLFIAEAYIYPPLHLNPVS